MFTPALERATQIPVLGPRKVAIDLAGRFEAAILEQSPRSGVFGPERTLVSSYEASSKTVRQALRILESRFLGNVRRGVGGGLVLRTPDLADSAQLMSIYLCSLGVSRGEVRDAAVMLQPELAGRSREAQVFATSLLEALEVALDDDHALASTPRSRALMVARHIVADLHRTPCATQTALKLGTLVDLQQRHASGRPIILQAIRILEELEVIEARLGRGGGIVARQPSLAPWCVRSIRISCSEI
jgi:DNA-binding FadR family transcriptional regulator